MKFTKDFFVLFLFSSLMAIEYFFLNKSLNLPAGGENLFLSDVLGMQLRITGIFIIIASIIDIFLIFILGNLIYSKKVGFISAFIFCTCPWILYLSSSGELLVFLVTVILLQMIGFVQRKLFWGRNLFSIAGLVLFASSLLLWPWVLATFWYFGRKTKNINIYLLFIPLILALCLFHLDAFKNIFTNQIALFKDVGLVNTVNQFQGETKNSHLFFVGRFVENKYIYLLEHLFFNFLASISPVTYFSPQYKLLNFAFTPPLFIALIIPLGFFLWLKFKISDIYKSLFMLPLLLPAVVAHNSPDLSRLVLVLPFLILAISFGLENLWQNKSRSGRILLIFVLLLFIFQSVVSIADITVREPIRMLRNQEVNK